MEKCLLKVFAGMFLAAVFLFAFSVKEEARGNGKEIQFDGETLPCFVPAGSKVLDEWHWPTPGEVVCKGETGIGFVRSANVVQIDPLSLVWGMRIETVIDFEADNGKLETLTLQGEPPVWKGMHCSISYTRHWEGYLTADKVSRKGKDAR